MKKFNLFGLNFKIEVKKELKEDNEIYSEISLLKSKIIYFLIIMFILSLSTKVPTIFRTNNYKRGDIVKEDIYAPKTIIFKDKDAKEKIIEDMIAKSEKKYIYSSNVEEIYISGANQFFEDIILIKQDKLKSFDYSNFEKLSGKKISDNVVNYVLELNVKEIEKLKERTINLLKETYLTGIYKEKEKIIYPKQFEDELLKLNKEERELVNTFTTANYFYDIEKTRSSIESKVAQIKDQYVEIKAGTLVVKTGEVLTDRKINILEKLNIYTYKTSIINLFFNLVYLILITTLFYTIGLKFYEKDFLHNRNYKAMLLLSVTTFLIYIFTPKALIYLIPLDTALFLLLFMTRLRFSSFIFITLVGYLMPVMQFDLEYFITYGISMILAGHLIKKITTRSEVIAIGIELAVIRLVFFFLFNFFSTDLDYNVAYKSVQIIVSGFFSGMLTIAILPYFERTFNILTIFRLMELGDLSHPLLSKMSIEAPGTFQHSMMVAVLSENAVRELGGNTNFTRVACYYHDIGKCKRPKFYVENQHDVENPHNSITPFMSKLIITSHTKDGSEMAKEYQIPKEIRDIMFEHQGTTLLAYFYNKAKTIDPSVTEEEFRYSGPKPRTKESAVIMLADSIEAAVRSMDLKNPVSIEAMIRKIIHSKIDDNQLSDANITFKEIDTIIKSFVKTFGAIYHERIKYPGQEKIEKAAYNEKSSQEKTLQEEKKLEKEKKSEEEKKLEKDNFKEKTLQEEKQSEEIIDDIKKEYF